MNQLKLAAAILAGLITLPLSVAAWNTPGHMLSGVIAYQILPRENASTIAAVGSWENTRGTKPAGDNSWKNSPKLNETALQQYSLTIASPGMNFT
jgi:hypothetical protein